MIIQVKGPQATYQIEVNEGWTVLELKNAIQAQSGFQVENQKLTIGGKIMKDVKPVDSYQGVSMQVVNLVITGGAASKPVPSSTGEVSGDAADGLKIDSFLSDLMRVMRENKQAQMYYEQFKEKCTDPTELREKLGIDGVESAKQKILAEITQVMGGNWKVLDKYVEPVRSYALGCLGKETITNDEKAEWVEKGIDLGLERVLSELLKVTSDFKPGVNLKDIFQPLAKEFGVRFLNLLVDGPSPDFSSFAPLFSDQLRLLVVTTVGSILDILISVLNGGKPKCQELMAKLCGMLIEKLGAQFPEYGALFAFAGPMAIQQSTIWHDEYIRTIKGKPHSFNIPNLQ